MIWVTWRQHRTSFLGGTGAVVALAALLLVTGLSLRSTFERLGLGACAAPVAFSCSDAASQFNRTFTGYQVVLPLLLVLPALVGVFWGAPLVAREVEQGTHRLAWMQSVSRRRWFSIHVAALAVGTVVLLGVATALVHWWLAPVMSVRPQPYADGLFDLVGIVPVAYGFGGLAIGIASGTYARRLLPAIALSLVLFLGMRVGIELGLRPRYAEPVSVSIPFPDLTDRNTEFPVLPSEIGWTTRLETVDASGRHIGDGVGFDQMSIMEACPELGSSGGGPRDPAMAACIARLGLRVEAVYQPADRYWRFQVTESLVWLALSGALLAASAWWIRRDA